MTEDTKQFESSVFF